jgi:hypothetical protein
LVIPEIKAQLPVNLVPNSSFEEGKSSVNPDCYNNPYFNSFTIPKDLNDYLQNWWTADPSPGGGIFGTVPTPDWFGPNCWSPGFISSNIKCRSWSPSNYGINRFIGMVDAEDDGEDEGARANLISKLEGGHSYFFRTKLMQSEEGSVLGVHFTKWGESWNSNSSENTRLFDAMNIGIANTCEWYIIERKLEVPQNKNNDLQNIILKASGSYRRYVFIDDVELFEYCPNMMIRQNREYWFGKETEEAKIIVVGRQQAIGYKEGDVIIHSPGSNSNTTTVVYKASEEVLLRNGFIVERGGDFTAKIAPCGSNCRSSNISLLTDYTICDNECITLGGPSVLGMTYSWNAITDEHLSYLSSTTVAKPVFCPPDGGSGTYTYNLTITNTCGESTTKTVYVHYDNESNPNPKFAITNSNLASNPDNPSLTINTVQHTEYVSVDILDCNNNILHSNTYKNGVDFTAPQEVNWQFGGFMSPCGCYKIRVRSKNYCYEDVKEEMLQWNRITTPTNVQFENFTRCEGGKRKICFSGSGVASVKLQLFNRKGLRDVSNTYNITGNPYCMEIPNDNEITNGQYAIIIDFIGCDGTIKNMTGFVSVFPCGDSFTDGGGTWNGDDYYNGGVYYENPENGTIDSLYSVLSPNPVLEGALITYHIPEAGSVKITLLNANFEQKAILVQNETMSAGDYQVQFSNAYLLNGVNYYMIELSNNQQARHIKRFSVVK